jgi:LPXTG-motif cell wall-anchored protein
MAAQPNELPKDGADQQADQPQDQTPAVSQATELQVQPADSTPTDPTPAALPKTASPYPLIGLSGLLSLGAYGLLRRKKQSA